ncbi:MAG: hypothetical protein KHX49_01145 [Lachnospiraceae bacterium]|uniref:Uncharacterized protein n=1 Tax=Candidatus Enterocloster excrementigallinarum TaxID=2838558 RepID=A0A9D2PWR6_9FIRM|nr:hypothetical protein [Lachnospiraceae bacterium]HJC67161.1 hypothetical protein [Candidatus Enterocloster excrementigallinarum]
MEENTVLCGANSYLQKYYFNQEFDSLPQEVKQELQIMCVLYTEDVGGILTLEFDEKGNLEFKVTSEEGDYLFDEIGSVLKIKQYQEEKRELLEALELYYRVFFLGEEVENEET